MNTQETVSSLLLIDVTLVRTNLLLLLLMQLIIGLFQQGSKIRLKNYLQIVFQGFDWFSPTCSNKPNDVSGTDLMRSINFIGVS